MTNYSIAEEYRLPSNGKIYTEQVNPLVKLRSMTTEEEMKRLAPSERPYKNLCEIIDDCCVESPGISSYDMCIADYQYLLQKLRVVTYGSEYPAVAVCPFCKASNEKSVDMNAMKVVEYDETELAKYQEFQLPQTKKHIRIKLQTPRMIDDVNEQTKAARKRMKNSTVDSAFLYTVQALIETVDGEVLDPVMKEDFVRKLPMMDTNYIMKHAQKLVESFGVDNNIEFTCSLCGLDYTSTFRVTSEFFGPSVHI